MKNKIILTLTPGFIDGAQWEKPLCVYKDQNPVSGVDAIKFKEFKEEPRKKLNEYETLIMVGLSNMMTPSNRTDEVWEYTFNQMDKNCISIDKYLFRSDPWRTWFHFGLIDAEYRDYTYSYLAETDYEKYYNGLSEKNPLSYKEIKKWGGGLIESNYKRYFKKFDIKVGYQVNPSEEYEYMEKLDELFKTKNTIGQVIRGLESYAEDIHPGRNVPSRHKLFKGDRSFQLNVTDLPVDEWKSNYLKYLADFTNRILEGFYES